MKIATGQCDKHSVIGARGWRSNLRQGLSEERVGELSLKG